MSSADRVQDDARQPPAVQAGSARSALLNILGEFTLQGPVPTPTTGALVRSLGEVGIGHHAARQAVQRCAKAGWITSERRGRESQWSISAAGRQLLSDGVARVEGLGADSADGAGDGWDGRWLVLVGSVPQDRRAVRERLYRSLRWNGFGSPLSGLWISARHERRTRVAESVRRYGLEDTMTAFVGCAAEIGLTEATLVRRAWDLKEISVRYGGLARRFRRVSADTPRECFRSLLQLDQELQLAPSWDPHLPVELTSGRDGRDDAQRLLALRAQWLGPARECWLELQS